MKNKTILSFAALMLALMMGTVASAQTATLTRSLDIGSQGNDVTVLQQFLAQSSSIYPEGLITGYYGNLTAAAVTRWQAAHSIDPVGRVGPITLAALNAQMGGGTTTGGGDVSAPTIYPEAVSVGQNSATISWATSEAAKSRVMYGASWPFLYSTAPSVSTSGYGSTANITLTGLQSHTLYNYVLESVDGSGNIMWTVHKPLVTQ